MRKFTSKKKESGNFDSVKLADHLNETLTIKGFNTEPTRFGDIVIIDTEEFGNMTTFSQVILSQLQEQEELGFPVMAKFFNVKKYYTMAEP